MSKNDISTTDQLAAARQHIAQEYARAAISKHGGNVRLLLPHVSSQIGLEFVRGAFEPRVLDEKKAIRLAGSDKPMTVDDLIAEMKRDRDFAGTFRPAAPTAPVPTKLKSRK